MEEIGNPTDTFLDIENHEIGELKFKLLPKLYLSIVKSS